MFLFYFSTHCAILNTLLINIRNLYAHNNWDPLAFIFTPDISVMMLTWYKPLGMAVAMSQNVMKTNIHSWIKAFSCFKCSSIMGIQVEYYSTDVITDLGVYIGS